MRGTVGRHDPSPSAAVAIHAGSVPPSGERRSGGPVGGDVLADAGDGAVVGNLVGQAAGAQVVQQRVERRRRSRLVKYR